MATESVVGTGTAPTPPLQDVDATSPLTPDPPIQSPTPRIAPAVPAEADAGSATIDQQDQVGETPSATDGKPPGAGRWFDNIKSWLKPLAWGAGAGLFIIFVFGIIRPQDGTSDPIGHNAALAWNSAIQRLGIQPLYPPQEEFFVGDVYLTVSPAQQTADKVTDYPTNVFEGKAVKVGQLPLKLSTLATGRLSYEKIDLKPIADQQAVPMLKRSVLTKRQPAPEIVDAVPLSLVSFPGITIKQTIEADGSWQSIWFGRSTNAVEEVSIPVAETYAVATIDALLALRQFCADPTTALYCQDENARRILQYTLGDRVNAVASDRYIFQLSVLVVTQVYLTSEFDVRRTNGDSLDASLGEREAPAPEESNQNTEAAEQAENQAGAEAPTPRTNSPRTGGRYHDERKSTQQLTRIFDRPLAFGFKSVAFALPSLPPKDAIRR